MTRFVRLLSAVLVLWLLGAGVSRAQSTVFIAGIDQAGNSQTALVDAANKAVRTDLIGSLPSGSNIIGKVGIDQTTPGTTNLVQIGGSLPAGTNVIGHVIVDSGTLTNVTMKPLDACGTTVYDYWTLLGTGATTVTSTTTCVDAIVVNNSATTSQTALLTDGSGTPLIILPTITIPAGGVYAITGLNGAKFNAGIKVTTSAANDITLTVHGRQ